MTIDKGETAVSELSSSEVASGSEDSSFDIGDGNGRYLPLKNKKPPWLKVRAPGSPEYMETKKLVDKYKLHTVCQEAACPNIGECWSHGTATFMIMGDLCTRRCQFCSVKDGNTDNLQPLDPLEPYRVAKAVAELKLQHAVITSVDRDDYPDGGADHFAKTIKSIHKHSPETRIEVLVPDFNGMQSSVETVVAAGLEVFNHNVETVPRLYKKVRPKSSYIRSLTVLRWAKEANPQMKTKSGIMVGLGESLDEVLRLMDDLRAVNVDIMTIGQYLRPTKDQTPVRRYVTPDEFKYLEEEGKKRGFGFIESGVFVRSSYHAWKHSEGVGY